MANEKRLIDVERAKRATYEEIFWTESEQAAVRHFLAKFPRVDAVEVVHGHWKIFDDGYGCELMSCSVCKAEFYDGDNDTVDHTHNYCPNCGAKMDGGHEDG